MLRMKWNFNYQILKETKNVLFNFFRLLLFRFLSLMVNLYFLTHDFNLRDPNAVVNFTSKKWHQKIGILCINGFIISPFAIFFWISWWDILQEWIFKENMELSLFCSWLIAHGLLIIIYTFQDYFQMLHEKLVEASCFEKKRYFWQNYDLAFFFRSMYEYIASLAYIAHNRAYWDAYDYYTDDFDYRIFLAVSVVCFFLYGYLGRGSYEFLNKEVPFAINVNDDNYEEFFKTSTFFELENVNWNFLII